MSLHLRRKNISTVIPDTRIICNIPELKEKITSWCKSERWEFENFADFLELIDIKTPVTLSNWNKENYSFKCTSALGKTVTLSICYGDLDFPTAILVTEEDTVREYLPNYRFHEKSLPELKLQSKNICRNGKKLYNYYCKFFCNRKLYLDDTHILELDISEPNKYEDKAEFLVLRNRDKVENYLLSLDQSLVISEVYDKVIALLGFSKKDISNSNFIQISYVNRIGEKDQVLSKISKVYGKTQEYAIGENDETFHVFQNGNWNYSSDNGINISCDDEHYRFSMGGSSQNIVNINPVEVMEHVERKIAGLWKFIEK